MRSQQIPDERKHVWTHPAVVWQKFRGTDEKYRAANGCKTRKPIDQRTFTAAVDAACEALRQVGGNSLDAPQITVAVVRDRL
jgi:hypothetical protein